MKVTLSIGAAMMFAVTLQAHASGYAAVTKMPGGLSLAVMDHGVSCNGNPVAFVTDINGTKIDQTCNVHIDSSGVTVRFAGYPHDLRFNKSEFAVMPAP